MSGQSDFDNWYLKATDLLPYADNAFQVARIRQDRHRLLDDVIHWSNQALYAAKQIISFDTTGNVVAASKHLQEVGRRFILAQTKLTADIATARNTWEQRRKKGEGATDNGSQRSGLAANGQILARGLDLPLSVVDHLAAVASNPGMSGLDALVVARQAAEKLQDHVNSAVERNAAASGDEAVSDE